MGKQLSLKELRDAILSTASARPGNSIPDDVDLFDEGYLDSFSVLQLIQVLEEKLDIVFDHRDLRREYFTKAENLLRLLVKKYDIGERK